LAHSSDETWLRTGEKEYPIVSSVLIGITRFYASRYHLIVNFVRYRDRAVALPPKLGNRKRRILRHPDNNVAIRARDFYMYAGVAPSYVIRTIGSQRFCWKESISTGLRPGPTYHTDDGTLVQLCTLRSQSARHTR